MKALLLLAVLAVWGVEGVFEFYKKHKNLPIIGQDYGEPVFVSPMMKMGKYEEARQAAKVPANFGGVESYAAFFTTNVTFDTNMYFWYFPAEKDPDTAPVLFWLQGGPGASSLFGLFTEMGPFYIDRNLNLQKREVRWSSDFHMVFVDSPVGTGFSFTSGNEDYARNQEDVARNLYHVAEQFFLLFPQLQKNDFYITGESYAGKYVPALARAVHEGNSQVQPMLKLNFKGIAIGDGYSAPDLMLDYGQYLYNIGLIDLNGRRQFEEKQSKISNLIQKQDWDNAAEELFGLVVFGGLFQNLTKYTFHYNFLHWKDEDPFGDMDEFLAKSEVRKAMHVGNLTFHTGETVQKCLTRDFPKPVTTWVEELLDQNYKVLIYSGQLDIIVAYPLTENFLQNLKWSGADLYSKAERKPWFVGDDLAGYTKTVKNLQEVLVRDAGHMVPSDQPIWAQDMIRRFVFGKPF